MTVAHIGVGLFAIGVTVTQSYRVEKDVALRAGESVELKGYKFDFKDTKQVQGPNYDAIQSEVVITRDGKLVATLHPQKRTYRVQTMPMTESGIEVDWNRDLFVAMGDDLGDGAWSVRVQYKPMVRFIWFGALVMALGGLLALSDRRYRTRRETVNEKAGVRGPPPPADRGSNHVEIPRSFRTVRWARRVPVRWPVPRSALRAVAADRQAGARVQPAEPPGRRISGVEQELIGQPWVLNVWVPGAAVAAPSTKRCSRSRSRRSCRSSASTGRTTTRPPSNG